MTVQIKSINNNCQHGRENEKIFILLTNRLCCGKITIIVLNAAKGNKTAAHLFREPLAGGKRQVARIIAPPRAEAPNRARGRAVLLGGYGFSRYRDQSGRCAN